MKKTYVALVLDRSGSMQNIKTQAIDAFNSVLTSIQKMRSKDHEVHVGVVLFNDAIHVHTPFSSLPVAPLTPSSFYCGGTTALRHAVSYTIDEMLGYAPKKKSQKDVSYLVLTFTDGWENASWATSQAVIKDRIAKLQDKGNWTFAFQVPKGDRKQVCGQFGVAEGNVAEWEQTEIGTREMGIHTQSAVDNYSAMRSVGASATQSFYQPVVTNLTAVTDKRVASKLDDMSASFKAFTVAKETDIKGFVETKTRKPYVTGSAYYQLMKPEKVQPAKSVVLVKKGGTEVWGGQQARDLIGLPEQQHALVTPGNHQDYDVFIQSRSPNRKLPRGTRVLVDVTLAKPVKPTWGGEK